MRRLIIGIIFDETICRLPLVTRHKDFVFQEIKAVERKHYKVAREDNKLFNDAYELANEAWLSAQKTFIDKGKEFSNVLFLKFLMEKEFWIVEYFGLKQKRFDKLNGSYDLSNHNLRTLQVYNEIIKQIDIVIAQYNHRNLHGKNS